MIWITGRYVLNLSDDCDYDDVCQEIRRQMHGDSEDYANTSDVIRDCVKLAVSAQCEEREHFVSQILSLPPAVQEHLMAAIQGSSDEECCEEDVDVHTESVLEEVLPSACDGCAEKNGEIEILHRELQASLAKQRDVEEQLRVEHAQHINKLMDLEASIVEKEAAIKDLQSDLEHQRKAAQDMETLVSEKKQLEFTISELQDRVDILSVAAKRTDVAENQIQRLRERLDMMENLREQLKLETSVHAETHDKLLAAEAELDILRKAKAQVEEYRTRVSESAIVIQELQMKIQTLQNGSDCLRRENADLSSGYAAHLSQYQYLTEELREASSHLHAMQSHPTLGDGISELNPQLMNELNRLKAENKELFAKLDATSLESLERLEAQLADSKAVNDALQVKYVTTKEQLQHANYIIEQLRCHIAALKQDVAVLNQRYDDSMLMGEEDQAARAAVYHQKINEINTEHTINMSIERSKSIGLLADIEEERTKLRRVEREKKFFEAETHRYKTQCQVAEGSGSANSRDIDAAIKEMQSMQAALDAANAEIARWKAAAMAKESSDETSLPASSSRQPKRIRVDSLTSGSNWSMMAEQSELLEKKIEALTKERREMISKSLEESKEKMELSQKLLHSEKEVASLKSKVTKLTLEKERLERKAVMTNDENRHANIMV